MDCQPYKTQFDNKPMYSASKIAIHITSAVMHSGCLCMFPSHLCLSMSFVCLHLHSVCGCVWIVNLLLIVVFLACTGFLYFIDVCIAVFFVLCDRFAKSFLKIATSSV